VALLGPPIKNRYSNVYIIMVSIGKATKKEKNKRRYL
jgi:hypothetical protein